MANLGLTIVPNGICDLHMGVLRCTSDMTCPQRTHTAACLRENCNALRVVSLCYCTILKTY